MNFNDHYLLILNKILFQEALGGESGGPMPEGEPTGKQENPAGTDANPQGPQPQAQQQDMIDPFELAFANFVLGLSQLRPEDNRIRNLPIEQIELNLSKQGSNPLIIKKFLKQMVQRFNNLSGLDVKQLNYNDPKFGNKLGNTQQILGWANFIVNLLKNIKNNLSTSNIELKNYTKIDSANIENFKKSLQSLGGSK